MKNSAWYSKLWHKKLEKLPVKSDAAAAWGNMQQMLNAHLPVSATPAATPVAAKSVVAKIVSMAAYALPAAAMVGAATWFAVKPPVKQKTTSKNDKHKEYRLKTDSISHNNDLIKDSLIAAERMGADAVNLNKAGEAIAYGDSLKSDSSSIPKTADAESIDKAAEGKAGGDVLSGNNNSAEKVSAKNKSGVSNSLTVNNNKAGSNSSVDKKRDRRLSSVYAGGLASGSIYSRQNNLAHVNSNGKSNSRIIKVVSGHQQKANATANPYKGGIHRELSNYIASSLNFSSLPATPNASSFIGYKNAAGVIAGNNSLLLAEDKRDINTNSNVNKFAGNKTATAKAPKNKTPKERSTPAFNFGLEAGLSVGNATGLYGGLTADYALTNRLLIGSGLRFSNGNKLSGSYVHPSFFRPDTASGFAINEERKVSAIQVPLNLTYKLSSLISLKAGVVIYFAGNPGAPSYTLGPVGGFRDTLRRAASIDSAVNKSVLTGKVSVGFTGGVSLGFKNFSVDARYMALPPYKVNNPLGNYSGSYNRFQIGVTYWFRQGAKK